MPTIEPFKKLINQGMIQGVIEFMFLQKEKENGYHRFVCSTIAAKHPGTDFARIPVPIEFVSDYGLDQSYLNRKGVDQFIQWSSDYKEAIFDSPEGRYHRGAFTAENGATDFKLISHSEVGKMSKSKYNVINPDDVIEKYGTDCFRMYEMFLGPLENSKPWDTKGIDGVYKFIKKLWRLFFDEQGNLQISDETPNRDENKILHLAIKKVQEDIERYSFNTCISHFMVAVNDLRGSDTQKKKILEPLVILLSPFAPHLAEELWHRLGHSSSVHLADFPKLDGAYLVDSEITYPISINGKRRGEESFSADASPKEIEEKALALEVVKKWTEGKTIKKVIVVPKRMVNIVISD
ncbi:MAG: class I tRNA ligase family protein [Saprospiraceae bacterium]|nr:class I tRNA ligase family protein [Saprospiraceae bacterium]